MKKSRSSSLIRHLKSECAKKKRHEPNWDSEPLRIIHLLQGQNNHSVTPHSIHVSSNAIKYNIQWHIMPVRALAFYTKVSTA